MKQIIILFCLLAIVSCKSSTIKKPSVSASSTVTSTKKKIKKKQVTATQADLRKIGDTLYYLRSPNDDKRFYSQIVLKANNIYKGKYPEPDEKVTMLESYYKPLLAALKKRIPEKDAKTFITKNKRFVLAYRSRKGKISYAGDILMPLGLGRGQIPIRYSSETLKKCGFIHPSALEGVDDFTGEYFKIRTDYIIRWNRTMLEDCKKH